VETCNSRPNAPPWAPPGGPKDTHSHGMPGATDYVVSQSPAAGTVETTHNWSEFAAVTLVGSCPD